MPYRITIKSVLLWLPHNPVLAWNNFLLARHSLPGPLFYMERVKVTLVNV